MSTRKRHLLPSSSFVTNNELLFSLRVNVFHFTRNTQIILDWHIVSIMRPTQLRTYNNVYNIHTHTNNWLLPLTHTAKAHVQEEKHDTHSKARRRARSREKGHFGAANVTFGSDTELVTDDVFEHPIITLRFTLLFHCLKSPIITATIRYNS